MITKKEHSKMQYWVSPSCCEGSKLRFASLDFAHPEVRPRGECRKRARERNLLQSVHEQQQRVRRDVRGAGESQERARRPVLRNNDNDYGRCLLE
ncbi:hypothetical protein AVEN_49493-1, partial [Araneus ventricosus]